MECATFSKCVNNSTKVRNDHICNKDLLNINVLFFTLLYHIMGYTVNWLHVCLSHIVISQRCEFNYNRDDYPRYRKVARIFYL